MASNNPYHITTPYEVSSQLAGYQKDVQDAELSQLKLGEFKRQLDEAALARNVKAEAMRGLQTSQEQAVPQAPVGLNPQPVAAPGSTEFWQGQNTAAPVQESNPMQQFKTAEKDFSLISGQIQQYSNIAKALKAKGLVDEAEQYDNKVLSLQDKADKAKEDYLTHSVKVLGLAGDLANGYMEAVKDNPAASDAAWARFALAANSYGADPEGKLMQIPPAQRAQVAQQLMDQSTSGKERARMAIEAMRTKAKADRDNALNDIRQKRIDSQNRNAAASREIQKERLAFQEGKFEFTTLDTHIKDQIKDAETRKTSIDKDLSNLQKSLLDLQKGNMFYTASGRPMSSDDPEVLANEAASLQEAIKAKEDEKKDLDNFVNDLNTERNSLTKNIPKKKIDTSKEFKHGVKYKFVSGANADDIKVYQEQMAAAKTEADKLRIQQKAFEYGLVEPK